MSDFDYGQKKADGQYERYPSSVLRNEDGTLAYKQPIRNIYVHRKCGSTTIMRGEVLCLTYATNPGFYTHTFCIACRDHLPIREFYWDVDGVALDQVAGEPGKDLRR